MEDTSSYDDDSSVQSSDLDGFIMSTQNNIRRKKRIVVDGLRVVETRGERHRRNNPLSTVHSRLSNDVRDLLGKGSMCFVQRDYALAIEYLEEAIRLAPGVADPFITLGAIYEELGDSNRAIEALLVAVHLTPTDHSLWKRVSILSESVDNTEQAIYCLKRCAKSQTATSEEIAVYQTDLANLLFQENLFAEAATVLKRIANRSEEETTMLAKCLYNTNQKIEAMEILENLTPNDANVVNMLAEVYLDVREKGKCFTLLMNVLDVDHLSDPEYCPVDLVAKLAIAAIPRHFQIIQKCIECIKSTPFETHSDLYAAVADALLVCDTDMLMVDLALSLADFGLPLQAGKCHYLKGNYALAAELLESANPTDPETILILADALRKSGRQHEEKIALLMQKISYEDLIASRTLPAAISTSERRRMLSQLDTLLVNKSVVRARNLFITLFRDCELDPVRISRNQQSNDLESVEDRIGTEAFVKLIESVCELDDSPNGELVAVIETILHNKRKKWTQRTTGDDFIQRLERVSFEHSKRACVLANVHIPVLFKTCIKYLREMCTPTISDACSTTKCRLLAEIVFDPKVPHRDLIDQRSWLVRTACKFPSDFSLCLLAGHFCVLSNNFRFAVAEFTRAHRLNPNDSWPLLLLAASMLSLAISRTTKNGEEMIQNAFGVLAQYTQISKSSTYNIARAHHQLAQFRNADREYRKILHSAESDTIKRATAYNLALMRQQAGLDNSATKLVLTHIVAT